MAEQGTRSKLSAPTRPTIILTPRPTTDDLFSSVSGLSPGPMTLVSAFFPDPIQQSIGLFLSFSWCHGFSGARLPPLNSGAAKSPLLTVPAGLSPSGLLISPGFYCLSPQSPFGISHQQALAQVTAQAAIVQSHVQAQMKYQTLSMAAPPKSLIHHQSFNHEETSSQMVPSASGLQSSAMEYAEASQSDRENQPSVAVDKPAEDGYNWRKYGQKPIKGCEYPRSYYKCTHSHCPVKKKVERSADGQITEIIYKGAHNHEKPQPNKQGKGSSDGNENSQAPELGSEGLTGNSNKLNEFLPLHVIPGTNHESTQAVELPGSSDNVEQCDEESREERVDDEPNPKRRNAAGEAAVSLSHKTVMEPKIVVQTRSEVDLLDDGYRWRKYGQKVVKGNPHPRSYYKCTSARCNVRKHVERASTDPKAVITTYEGKHNHDVPASRTSNQSTITNSLPLPKPNKVASEKNPLLKETDFGKKCAGSGSFKTKRGANKSGSTRMFGC
ncbi:putative WRKY transcription factor 58 [Hibiscus syriacus]|uniref:WRKY transcription factor 58 n=1 Tax=Hibiscus syriacus TaxID=106335 RepID=A0A6A2ZCY6_HIBSY|nr:putative WRKY transcription factor 58 [Hibiscus syriacus]